MTQPRALIDQFDRRQTLRLVAAVATAVSVADVARAAIEKDFKMTMVCFIRYQIDPYQRRAFETYAKAWGTIIPRCGGRLIGYFLPWEGTNDVAWGLIGFDSLASYGAYRARLRLDPEGKANFEFAQRERFILREERNFVEVVDGTFQLPPT